MVEIMDFLRVAWSYLSELYLMIRAAGAGGGLLWLLGGFVIYLCGSWLTGEPASASGPVIGGTAYLTHHPGREGHANGILGILLGILLKFAGMIVMFTAIFATVNSFLYGPLR